jgi:sulfhydrogenase subunit alpha
MLLMFEPKLRRTTAPVFVALIPESPHYGYFGNRVRSTEGWEAPIGEYQSYLSEVVPAYSHAKRSTFGGESFMVGSLARLNLFGDRLTGSARDIFALSPIAAADSNTAWNNLGQAIEIVQAIDRCMELIGKIGSEGEVNVSKPSLKLTPSGHGVGAVECPRGTLYHSYLFDSEGSIIGADMVTPSAQNTARIEQDIREVVESNGTETELLQSKLETLVRAYDPCNTCATHMVQLNYINTETR